MNPHGGPDAFDEWIGIDEAAAYLAIPKRTLYVLAQRGRLPATKVGRTWRFKRSRLDEHLADAVGRGHDAADGAASRQLQRLVAEQGGLLSELTGLADLSVRLSALTAVVDITAFVSDRLYEIFAVDQARRAPSWSPRRGMARCRSPPTSPSRWRPRRSCGTSSPNGCRWSSMTSRPR